jgi:hypothetical protein
MYSECDFACQEKSDCIARNSSVHDHGSLLEAIDCE